MKTEDLVSLLSTGAQAVDLRRASRRWLLALAGGALMAFLLTAGLLKLNPVLWHETYKPMFWVRESYCAVLGVLGFITVVRLARPGLRLGLAPMGIPVAVIAMWVLAVVTLVAASPQNRAQLILG
ncbi:MAG TPA: NrsF family protein, partial [Steroidobacteraceae bacterium]|nr:NrsF family protein [Steroidobacteraceae bacterium]